MPALSSSSIWRRPTTLAWIAAGLGVLVFLILVTVAVVTWVHFPTWSKPVLQPTTWSDEQAVRAYLQESMNDPDSLEVVRWGPHGQFQHYPNIHTIRLIARGRNGFGAKTISDTLFFVRAGQVIGHVPNEWGNDHIEKARLPEPPLTEDEQATKTARQAEELRHSEEYNRQLGERIEKAKQEREQQEAERAERLRQMKQARIEEEQHKKEKAREEARQREAARKQAPRRPG